MYVPVDHQNKICLWDRCQKEFKPSKSNQICCNKNCYRKYGKKVLQHSRGKFNSSLLYRRYKKQFCINCGFTGHTCQLDIDHIDGNHNNDSINNLQTLCANCHRLKTYKQRWIKENPAD